jgi:hypothetical protein
MLFAFCPHVFSHTAHIQLLMIGPLPFVFLALHAFVERRTWTRAVGLGLAIGAQALFCAYYGVLAGLLVGLGVLYFSAARRLWRDVRWWALVLLAAAVAVAIVLPFFLPYLQLQKETGFGRELDEARRYSADWRTYLASAGWFHAWMLKYLGRTEEVLFPGFTALAFGAVGIAVGLRRARETAIFYLLVAILALWASFGPAAGLYTVLYETVPVFSLLRAPARFGLAVSFALAVFAAIGFAALLRAPRFGAASLVRNLASAVLLIAVAADMSVTMPFRDAPPFERAYQVLAGARPGPVAEFPFFYVPTDFHRHARYMLRSTRHWQPLVNGYSDYIPRDWADSTLLLSSFPNPEGFEILRARRARYVVFHLNLYNHRSREALLSRIRAYAPYLRPLVQEEDVWLFEIVDWPTQHPDLSAGTPKAP